MNCNIEMSGFRREKSGRVSLLPLLATSILLSGCASMPSNGPTAGYLKRAVTQNESGLNITLQDITGQTVRDLTSTTAASGSDFGGLDRKGETDSPDMIRPGDTLSISIFEVGVSLFSAQSAAGSELSTQINNPVANGQRINGAQVDENGNVQLPYIGNLAVAGLGPRAVEAQIEQRLRGMSQSPRAMVSIADSLNSTVYLIGAVRRPGRYRLSLANERLREYLAVAGGYEGDPSDILVRLTRGNVTREMRLSDIPIGSDNDLRMLAGDKLELLARPRTYTVFGASDKVAQIPFNADPLTLSEAVARVGGPSDARANPKGIFLFRMVPNGDNQPLKPVIYRLNMMDPASYFLAREIAMQDKDLIYFSNSASGPPTKFIGVINQLFGPFVTARALAR